MSRKLQHIAPMSEVQAAKREGRKAVAFCGSRNYPMTEMGNHVPTCSTCTRMSMDDYEQRIAELEAERRTVYRGPITITMSGSSESLWRWIR